MKNLFKKIAVKVFGVETERKPVRINPETIEDPKPNPRPKLKSWTPWGMI